MSTVITLLFVSKCLLLPDYRTYTAVYLVPTQLQNKCDSNAYHILLTSYTCNDENDENSTIKVETCCKMVAATKLIRCRH